jgi:hypothetical protein
VSGRQRKLPKEGVSRSRRCRTDRARARRFHLCCISIFTQAGLDHGVAADIILVILVASRTDAVAENARLDRLLVTSGRNNLDFAWQERNIAHRRRTDISRSGWRPQWCARRGGYADARHDRFRRRRHHALRESRRWAVPCEDAACRQLCCSWKTICSAAVPW